MKLPMSCMQCFKEQGKPSEEVSFVEFRDDGRYEFICRQGHQTTTILQQHKFEILFDIGAYAIDDGYYREAVSSFSSSLERFYEFYIKVISIEKNIDEEIFRLSWKMVSKQSERQLGAFILLYTLENGKAPTLLHDKKVNFRNDVIHKGVIPTKEQALEYGNAVLEVIRPIFKQLKEKYTESIIKAILQHLGNIRNKGDIGKGGGTMSIGTILSLSITDPNHDNRSLEQAISELMKFE